MVDVCNLNVIGNLPMDGDSSEVKFFLTNFLVTLVVYAFAIFVYPAAGTVVPRIFLMWAAPISGTLAALLATRTSLPGQAFGAQALAMYLASGVYCLVHNREPIVDTLQYFTTAYFLPGALLALLVGISARWVL